MDQRGTIPATGLSYPRDWPVMGERMCATALIQRYVVGLLTSAPGDAPDLARMVDEDATAAGFELAAYARLVKHALGGLARTLGEASVTL